ncbi:Hypothetical protein FKW44_013164, partial [Caligus rogercresseyi]
IAQSRKENEKGKKRSHEVSTFYDQGPKVSISVHKSLFFDSELSGTEVSV